MWPKCGHAVATTVASKHRNRVYLHGYSDSWRAGEGTRTLKLSRARAPKTRAFSISPRPQRADRTASLADESVGVAAYLGGIAGTEGAHTHTHMRSAEQFDTARRLIAAGVNDCAIARQIGVPRATVQDWRRRPQIRPRLVSASPCGVVHDFSALPAAAYCYVLGLYLGDGCISRDRRVWRLRITLDKKYPAIIDRCREAIDMLMPGQRAGIVQQAKGCAEVTLYSKHWPCLLPQHGPGKKHLLSNS